MKTKYLVFILISLLTFSLPLHGQDYRVIFVRGRVIADLATRPVQTGDMLKSSSGLRFETQEAVVIVISSQGRRYTLKPATAKKHEEKESLELVKELLMPSRAYLSSRDDGSSQQDLFGFFRRESLAVTGDELELPLDTLRFPDKPGSFFMLLCETGRQVCHLPLYRRQHSLLLRKPAQQAACGNCPYQAVYVHQADTVFLGESSFTLSFPEKEELDAAIPPLIKALRQNGADTLRILEEISAFISECWGIPDPDNLRNFLQTHYLP
ncbi:MAG TPA: hypothetical protein P5531_01510 [Bacteroidales bacterium]|nr:hypothetical protein [Bacteroidales bacterium]HSA42332.1 hypothetical protein [Bacteroidales bacterium]